MKKFRINEQLLYTLLSIILGFLVGAVILSIAGFNPIEAYSVMIQGVIGKPRFIAWTIVYATPLILTGLSVAFAFRTGLFNIGAEGQYIIGSMAAVLVGYFFDGPAIIHIPLAIIAGCLAGALWAAVAGLLKAKFGINEVISTIMLNWTALYLSNFVTTIDGFRLPNSEASYSIKETASIGISFLKPLVGTAKVNWGIVIAIIAAILVYYIIFKTTLGYELRAVGYNKHAAEYGGINVNKSIVISMAIAGGLAGLAGVTQVLGVSHMITILAAAEGYGFDGMAVSLIGANSPFGVLLAGLLFGGLKYGGSKLQTIGAPPEVVSIVIGSIIYFIAASSIVKILINKFKVKGGRKNG